MKILIVDDEKIILEKLKMYISQIFTEKDTGGTQRRTEIS